MEINIIRAMDDFGTCPLARYNPFLTQTSQFLTVLTLQLHWAVHTGKWLVGAKIIHCIRVIMFFVDLYRANLFYVISVLFFLQPLIMAQPNLSMLSDYESVFEMEWFHLIENCTCSNSTECEEVKQAYKQHMQSRAIELWNNHNNNLLHHPACRYILIILYTICIIIGVSSNSLFLYVVHKTKAKVKGTMAFLVLLAVSDLILAAVSAPVQLKYYLNDFHLFGKVSTAVCKAAFSSLALPMLVSTLAIILIALDRYRLIVCFYKDPVIKCNAKLLVSFVAVAALVFFVPLALVISSEQYVDKQLGIDKVYCVENWPFKLAKPAFTVLQFFLHFVTPLVLTVTIYMLILGRICQRPTAITQQPRNNSYDSMRTTRVVVTIIVLFITCWAPFNVVTLMMEFKPQLIPGQYKNTVDLVVLWFALLSTCTNPILYCWMTESFRREIIAMWHKMRCRTTMQQAHRPFMQVADNNNQRHQAGDVTELPPDQSRVRAFSRTTTNTVIDRNMVLQHLPTVNIEVHQAEQGHTLTVPAPQWISTDAASCTPSAAEETQALETNKNTTSV